MQRPPSEGECELCTAHYQWAYTGTRLNSLARAISDAEYASYTEEAAMADCLDPTRSNSHVPY